MTRDDADQRKDARASIDEAIGMDARQTTIRLPDESEPLTEAQQAQIIEAVKAHLKAHGLHQRELAQSISYDASTVNGVLQSKYKGKTDAVLRAMAAFIADDERRRSGAKPLGFYDTSIFIAIRSLATYAKKHALSVSDLDAGQVVTEKPRIVIGYGPAGIGKTVGAKAYCLEDPRAVYVRVRGGALRVPNVAADIQAAMSVRGPIRGRATVQRVYDALRGSQRLLIVDEGHRLNFPVSEFLRDLSDVCGIPIMILCTQEFYHKLSKVRRSEGAFGYDQFTSRVGYVVDLLRGADGKGGSRRPFFSLEEIQAIFRRDQLRITSDGYEFLQSLACLLGAGMLRCCATVFDKAATTAVRKGVPVNMELLESSLDASMVPKGVTDSKFIELIRGTLSEIRGLNAAPLRKSASA